MAKRPATAKKTLSATNLAALGADRLADLLIEVGSGDAGWKRRLRMELAAEVGAPDLAFEIDKRLTTLANARTRVSWRKRPELLDDLRGLQRMIVDRLAPLDVKLALDRLVLWFDLYPGLDARVKDPKGELALLFDAASGDLAATASTAGPDVAGPVLGEALQTRLSEWGAWIGRGAAGLDRALAARLLTDLTAGRPRPTGRLALVVRKLADRAGDLDAWITALPDEDHRKPEVGAEIARRLAHANRPVEARAALEASRPVAPEPARWTRPREIAPPPPPESWLIAEIAVLDAEGREEDAEAARWMLFERTLAEAPLREVIARLPDFEDVVALDRAHAHAAAFPDATKGLAFLMGWPAYREAAEVVMARSDEIRGSTDDVPLWAARLEGRYPLAALLLVRSRTKALARLAGGLTEEVQSLIGEAAVLAATSNPESEVPDHAAFIAELDALVAPPRRVWR